MENSLLIFAKFQKIRLKLAWRLDGNSARDSAPPHIVSVRVLHTIFPRHFRGESVLSGHTGREHQMNPSSANDIRCLHWSSATCTEHIRHGLHNSSCLLWKCLPPWHYLGFAFSACVCSTEGLGLCRHRGKRRRSFALFLCASAKLGDRDLSMTSSVI